MKVASLDELNLHDSRLTAVMFRRADDEFVLELQLEYRESYDRGGFVPALLRFVGCATILSGMCCWISACDSIFSGETMPRDVGEKMMRNFYKDEFPYSELSVHFINLATSNGRLVVACRDVDFEIVQHLRTD